MIGLFVFLAEIIANSGSGNAPQGPPGGTFNAPLNLVDTGPAAGLLTVAPPGSTAAAQVTGSTFAAQQLIAQGSMPQASPYGPPVQQSGPLAGYVTGAVTQPIATEVGGKTIITNVPTGILNLVKSGRI